MSKPDLMHNFSLSVSSESINILMFESLVLGLETKCTTPPHPEKKTSRNNTWALLALLESLCFY